VVYVDQREGGGEKHNRIQICQNLKNQDLRYEVRSNPEALHDYALVWREQSDGIDTITHVDYLLPILIERKESKDCADSMREWGKNKRWKRQKDMMICTSQTLWPGNDTQPILMYVLENTNTDLLKDPKAFDHLQNCGCCDGVSGCVKLGYPSIGKLLKKIEILANDATFTKHSTRGSRETAQLLKKVVREWKRKIQNNLDGPKGVGGLEYNDQLKQRLTVIGKKYNPKNYKANKDRKRQQQQQSGSSSDISSSRKRSRTSPSLTPASVPTSSSSSSSSSSSVSHSNNNNNSSNSSNANNNSSNSDNNRGEYMSREYNRGTLDTNPANSKNKFYRPKRRGSNYAILITLLVNEQGKNGAPLKGAKMTKDEIFNAADRNWNHGQGLCKDGMRDNHRRNGSGYHYDASSGISQLLDKDTNHRSRYLIKTPSRNNRPQTLHLTDEGRRIAHLCHLDAHYVHHDGLENQTICGCGELRGDEGKCWMTIHESVKLKNMCTDVGIKKSGTVLDVALRLKEFYENKKKEERDLIEGYEKKINQKGDGGDQVKKKEKKKKSNQNNNKNKKKRKKNNQSDVDDVEDNVKRKRQKVIDVDEEEEEDEDDEVDWANKKETSSSYGLPDSGADSDAPVDEKVADALFGTDFMSERYIPTPVSRESASSASSSSSLLGNNSKQVISLTDSDSDSDEKQYNNIVEKQQPDVVDLT